MTKYAKRIAEGDNVATAVADVEAGDEIVVKFKGKESVYKSNQVIPFGHKMAISEIKKGEPVVKYGESIGSVSTDIKVGDWVHTHNLSDDYICIGKDGKPLPGQE